MQTVAKGAALVTPVKHSACRLCPPANRHVPQHAASTVRKYSWTVQAIQVSGPLTGGSGQAPDPSDLQGQISSELIDRMRNNITEALEAQRVDIADAYGDGRHVSIDVVSKAFEGLTSVKRQRLVYKAIWQEMQETVHAVDAMTTKTPEEAGLA